ncbi:MAG: hypothetical protein AAFM91_02625 [Pseudomonadota bacterium]
MNIDRMAAVTAIAAFVVAVGIGLYFSGSPGEQRQLRFDQQRITHLKRVKNSIDAYWRTHRSLPARVDADVIGLSLGQIPRDPETNTEYHYEVTGDNAYRLCAVFVLASPEHGADDFWAHDIGRQCFDFRVTESGA